MAFFQINGIVAQDIFNGTTTSTVSMDRGYSAIQLENGNILTAGYSSGKVQGEYYSGFALAQYLPDGTLDTTFGEQGFAILDADLSSFESVSNVIVQEDGKILVAGTITPNGAHHDMVVARFNPDGTVDENFGDGGVFMTHDQYSHAHSLALQEDGKILVGGITQYSNIKVIRLNSDGQIDTSFSDFNQEKLNNFASTGYVNLAVQEDGGIVIGASKQDAFAIRLTSSGNLDQSFDNDGVAVFNADDYLPTPANVIDMTDHFETVVAVAVQDDGKIVLAGSIKHSEAEFGVGYERIEDTLLIRYNPDGSLDTTFGSQGFVVADLMPEYESNEKIQDLAIQEDGKIVVTGSVRDFFHNINRSEDLIVARFNEDGTLDSSFGENGSVISDFDNNNLEKSHSVSLQDDGKILIMGTGKQNPDQLTGGDNLLTGEDFLLIRYLLDGTLDTGFGPYATTGPIESEAPQPAQPEPQPAQPEPQPAQPEPQPAQPEPQPGLPPVFTGGDTLNLSIAENTTAVTQVQATDADPNDRVSLTLSGEDAELFLLTDGQLTFKSAPDYENPQDQGDSAGNNTYVVMILAEDQNGGTATQTITVSVTDEPDTPTGTSDFDDKFVATQGANFNGGPGRDMLFVEGALSDSTITRGTPTATVVHGTETETLSSVEVLLFGGAVFDEAYYLDANPDVAAAVIDGQTSAFAHYIHFGHGEGRTPNAEGRLPEVVLTTTGFDPIGLDATYYLEENPDVAAAVARGEFTDARQHFDLFGRSEGRDPNALFDTDWYLEHNPDVAAVVATGALSAYDHYLAFGGFEGRNASDFFASALYLSDNPDVAAAGVNPLLHFLAFGVEEGSQALYIGDAVW